MTKQQKAWKAIPSYALGEAPEDLQTTAAYRAVIAKRAIEAAYEDGDAENIADLLADIRHLCDSLNLNLGAIDREAHRLYREEVYRIKEAEAAKTKTQVAHKSSHARKTVR